MKRFVGKSGVRTTRFLKFCSHRSRKGAAQVELAVFLPLYAAVLMLLPTLSNFVRTHQSVVITARHQAWMKQSRFGDETETLAGNESNIALPGRILLGEQEPSAGLISGRDESQATVYLKALDVAVDARSEHFAFTDPWDFRMLEFKDAGSHPRLTMGERVLFAGDVDRDAFASLANTAGASSAGASLQLSEIARQRKQAVEKSEQAITALTKAIDNTEDQILQLEEDLSNAKSQIPVNSDEVDSLDAALRTARQKLNELKANLKELEIAKSILGTY